MKATLLLITADPELALRVRRVLPNINGRSVDLTVVSGWDAAVESGGWLLALADVCALDKPPGKSAKRSSRLGAATLPVLWLGQAPQLTAGLPDPEQLPGPVIDFLDRNLPPSKLAFILQQHVVAALTHRRTVSVVQPHPERVHAALNNALTGILGNAELAVELVRSPNRRGVTPLAQRLECIVELAGTMRSLVEAAEMNSRHWRQHGGALSTSGRALPGIETRTSSGQRERPGPAVAGRPQLVSGS